MTNKNTVRPGKANRTLKFGYCPQCGRKGLYHVQQRYYRCRYCGLYRISPPEQGS